MSERAHPDDPGFRVGWRGQTLLGWLPWFSRRSNPYREALFWRYEWASQFCRGKRVLDIPCGMGWGTSLIKHAANVVGIDVSADAVNEARKRYGRHIRFEIGDMKLLKFPDASFDVVCCLEGIEHISPDAGREFLMESRRVMAPGGVLLLSSPYCKTKPHSGNPYHVHEYRPKEIQTVVEEHYLIDEII
ncbi:MAG TPA: class I SAM-dependent methyltransferase [Kiritimatiellia bacterium]|nr:class I SAM-dependent methyltransferase [Kiritimatiellia bacterium]